MVRPTGMRLFTVTFGPAQSQVLGTPMGMRIEITPSTSVTWAATGTPLPAYREDVSALDGLQGSITLPDPDQDGFIDGAGRTVRNWTYTATVQYTAAKRAKLVATKVFTHYASEPSTVDLENIIPVTATGGTKLAVTVPNKIARDGNDIVFYDISGTEIFRTTIIDTVDNTYDGGVIY